MIAVIFRWRVEPERRAAFEARWREATIALQTWGSGGSALFEAADGWFWAIARWPDAQTRERAFLEWDGATGALADLVAESLDPVVLDAVTDLWVSPPADVEFA